MEKHSFRKFHPVYAIPMNAVERFYPRLYEHFIFVSPVTKEKVTTRLGRKSIQCHLIPNGINEDLLEADPEDGAYILFFSRIDIYTKGLDILVEAFKRIASEYPEIRLILAGYEFDSVEALTADCPPALRERIEYAGFVTGGKKRRLLSRATFVILPSRHESSPVSILEAAACGKPVLVSDIPELDFVTDEGFGFAFPSGSVEGLAEKIRVLMDHEEKRDVMGRKGREFAGRYLWDRIAKEFEGVLNSTKQIA